MYRHETSEFSFPSPPLRQQWRAVVELSPVAQGRGAFSAAGFSAPQTAPRGAQGPAAPGAPGEVPGCPGVPLRACFQPRVQHLLAGTAVFASSQGAAQNSVSDRPQPPEGYGCAI